MSAIKPEDGDFCEIVEAPSITIRDSRKRRLPIKSEDMIKRPKMESSARPLQQINVDGAGPIRQSTSIEQMDFESVATVTELNRTKKLEEDYEHVRDKLLRCESHWARRSALITIEAEGKFPGKKLKV
jgi:hypothetical protein